MKIPLLLALFLFFTVCLFRYWAGPFYWGDNSDPSYFYIFNFIDVLEKAPPPFVDHPGVTLDLLGAAVMKIFFSAPKGMWLATYVLQSEKLLTFVWLAMTLLYIGSFIFLGWVILQKSKDRVFTNLVLLSGLWLIAIHSFKGGWIEPISANVNSDTMMMVAVNLMLLAIINLYFSPQKNSILHSVMLGIATAFALATKFTAAPFIVVACVMLPRWWQRIAFILITIICFVFLTAPIWGSYGHMVTWLKGLILSREMHGHGSEGFDPILYFQGMVWIFHEHWFFVLLWVVALVIGLKGSRTLLALAMGGICQWMVVAKQPSYQYMAPMIGLSGLILACIYKEIPVMWNKGLKQLIALLVGASLLFIGVSLYCLKQETKKTKEILRVIETQYASSKVCPFYRSSIPGFSFIFWNRLVHRWDYAQILKENYPQLVYYDIFSGEFRDAQEELLSLKILKKENSQVLIYGSDMDTARFEPYLTVRKIYSNGGSQALYEVLSHRSPRGMKYYQQALGMLDKGQYQEALVAAQLSKELGVEESNSIFIRFLQARGIPKDY